MPTKAVEVLYDKFGGNLIVVGDMKTPEDWGFNGIRPISPVQKPFNHYARKNFGYLEAIKRGAKIIYDTDDDNIPNENWGIRQLEIKAAPTISEGWFNVYDIMTVNKIWPRGFSLRYINKEGKYNFGVNEKKTSSIQQGLADGEPDVDAIWRFTINRKNSFRYGRSIFLQPNTWCPFNSQSTWWFPKAYPLMYLPITATFRMTDIYRSFVAQRCLWEINDGVTFHSPSEVFQDRNKHDLLKDFEDEVHGYLNVDKIVDILGNLKLQHGEEKICENLLSCYAAIAGDKILPPEEIYSVKQWVKDYETIVNRVVSEV